MDGSDLREWFRSERATRTTKATDKSRIALPSKEGYVDLQLVHIPGQRPFQVRYVYYNLGQGKRLVSCNTTSERGYLEGPDPIARHGQKIWAAYRRAKDRNDREEQDARYREASIYSPKPSYLWRSVQLDKLDEGVKVLCATAKLHTILVDGIAGLEKLGEQGLGAAAFDMGSKGYTCRVVKSPGSGGFASFDKTRFVPRSTAIGTPEQCSEWVKSAPSLDAIDVPNNVAELEEALGEYLSNEGDDPRPMPTSKAGDRVVSDAELASELDEIVGTFNEFDAA
jgi:hypothetical protein